MSVRTLATDAGKVVVKRLALLVCVLSAATACTQSAAPDTTAVVPPDQISSTQARNPTTTASAPESGTAHTVAIEYPGLPIVYRPIAADERPYVLSTRSDLPEDDPVPEFVYGNDFSPSNIDLNPPRPVEFTNSTDEDVVIVFSADELPDLPLAAGASDLVDFTLLPEEVYRFHVMRGNAKITGFIDMRPQGTSILHELDDTPVRQAPFSGRFSIEVPTSSEWFFHPQYDAIVAKPVRDAWSQGDFQWSLVSGRPLVSSGMRLQFARLDDPAAVLVDPVVPENCQLEELRDVVRSGFSGREAVYQCALATLYLGYLETGEDHFVYALSDAAADPTDKVAAALDSIVVHPDADAVPITSRPGPVGSAFEIPPTIGFSVFDGYTVEPYPVDIEGGVLTSGLAAESRVDGTTVIVVRNWDETDYVVEVNGREVVDLAAGHAVSFDLLDFGQDHLQLDIVKPPFAGYGSSIDLTLRNPEPPEQMYHDKTHLTVEVVEAEGGVGADAMGVSAIALPVPVGWLETGDAYSWEYWYARQASDFDPAELQLNLLPFSRAIFHLESISEETRSLPEDLGRRSIRGSVWEVYQWRPEGHPVVTLMLLELEGEVVFTAQLKSAPEDHEHLYDEVLTPLVSEFYFISSD